MNLRQPATRQGFFTRKGTHETVPLTLTIAI